MARRCKTLEETSIHGACLFFEDVMQCRLKDIFLFQEILEDKNLTTIRVVSLDYDYERDVYLGDGVWRTEGINTEMTLRKEIRGKNKKAYWYAYRRVMGKLHKKSVGACDKVTLDRLLEIAKKLPSL